MPILSPSDAARVREMLANLPGPVRLVFFTQTLNCETCEPTKQILGEVAELSGQITVQEHNFLLEKDMAAQYGIDRVPASAVVGAQDYGVRFFAIPSGYEFMSLKRGRSVRSKKCVANSRPITAATRPSPCSTSVRRRLPSRRSRP